MHSLYRLLDDDSGVASMEDVIIAAFILGAIFATAKYIK